MSITFELSRDMLFPVIQRIIPGQDFKIVDFSLVPLKPGAGNPTSLGVYRVTALIKGDQGEFSTSVVVKHLASGAPFMDTSDISHWNHWRREIEFFESPLVALIPDSINFPIYYGHTKLDDGTELFWNEDLGDLAKTIWRWEDCLYAAQLVADLNSIDSSTAQNYPWLNRTQLEGWLELRPTFFEPLYPKVVEIAKSDPEIFESFENFGPYLTKHELINEILHSLPQCYVHGDFNLNNLVTVKTGKTFLTALDWQLFGVAAIGSEIAAIFNTARELGVIEPSIDKFDEISRVYTSRFNLNKPENKISLNEVRLAAAAMGYCILEGVGFYFNQPEPDKSEAENSAKLKAMLVDFSVGPLNIYASVLHELLGDKKIPAF